MKKKAAVLGVTGSIGKNTLEVLAQKKEELSPVLFTAHNNYKELLKLKSEFPRALIALSSDRYLKTKNSSIKKIDFIGRKGLLEAIAASKADISVNGISGAAGLEPSLAVIESGSHLALANKESVVMAGELLFSMAKKKKVKIIPVDSEHMALYKLLNAHGRNNIEELILTASGGPFRSYSIEKLKKVSVKDALSHPTYNMGAKITIDSASLANKGLEVIEAAKYFNFAPEKIKVVVHPQSIVHSMIRLKDGSVYAQLSKPDMRLTIHQALSSPKTEYCPFGRLDFTSLNLSFIKPDVKKFPMLDLAYRSLNSDNPFLPAAFNGANEIAVDAFVNQKVNFLEIPLITAFVIKKIDDLYKINPNNKEIKLHSVLYWDNMARKLAKEAIKRGVN